MCVPCNPPTSINHRRRSIFNQCKNPCHFPNSIVEHIKFVSGARKKTHSVDVSLIFYYECEMQHIFFLLLASVGRLYGSHGWAKEIEYVFLFVGVAKNERFGSNRFDTHRATEFNWHLVGGRAHRKEQILFSNGRGESLEKIFPSRVEHVAFYYLASGNKYRSRHWIPFYIRVFRTYRGVLIM